MLVRVIMGAAAALLLSAVCQADTGCEAGSLQQYRSAVRIVDSLRPEKAGQQRVFLADGSQFNAGQAQWMKARLREYADLCVRGTAEDRAQAAKILADVRELLQTRRRNS
jgi:hypothetical protein